MNEDILQGTIAFAATWVIGIIFILFAGRKKKKQTDNSMSRCRQLRYPTRAMEARLNDNDPLKTLREDTYSNEELDEMTGRMHREQYRKENTTETSPNA